MGIILFLTSLIVSAVFVPIGIVFGFFKQLRKGNFLESLKDISKKFRKMAVSVDFFGNVVCAEFFDAVLIKNSGHLFGDGRETISSVVGKNYKSGNLTRTGRLLNWILNTIEKDHSIKSIQE